MPIFGQGEPIYDDEPPADGGTTGGGTGGTGTPPPATPPPPPSDTYTPPPVTGGANPWTPNPGGTLVGEVQKFSDLPTGASVGDIYRVAGTADSAFVSYYVRWSGAVWDETVAPDRVNAIKASTMPHALVRKADGTFELTPFAWKPRRVGDEVTNPAPAFVGRTIRDVFFHQNRLGFVSDESVVFSVAGDYGDFWRRTVLDYLDADGFSISATTTDVALLDFAVPFNDGIMLFSAQRQFSLSNGEAGLAVSSVEINPVTNFALTPGVRPAPIGNRVYFASEQGSYTAIQEYQRLDGSDALDAAEITAHVPALLPGGVTKLVSAPDLNSLFVFAKGSSIPSRLFTYQFYWDGDRKVQSAWRRWAFGNAVVVSGTFNEGILSLITRRGDKAYLEAIDLRPRAVSDEQDSLIYLDRQVTLTGTYDALTNLTTFTFPYDPDPVKLRLVRTKTAAAPQSIVEGAKVTVDGNVVTVEGDESAAPVTAGERYKTYLRFSQQFPQDYQGRPLTTGRLQLHSWSVTFTDTAFFTAEVQPYGPDVNLAEDEKTLRIQYSGQIAGDADFRLGQQAYRTGVFTFSVAGEARKATVALSNDTPFASTWVSAEWEGIYWSKAR